MPGMNYQAVKGPAAGEFAVAKKFEVHGQEGLKPSAARRNRPVRPNRPLAPGARADESRITDPRLVLTVKRANGPLKRLFDVVASGLALLFLLPVFLTVAVLIAILDPGPIFFGHERVGRQGRLFKCWKFRSMVVDSKQRLEALLASDPAAKAEWEKHQKLTNDPRITALGAFLRRTSLDELPQFWNVLKGEMSLIGPRPITRAELDRYGRDRRYYLVVRPGISGLWQVSGRSQTNYDQRVALDREYVERWSFIGDLRIAVMTIPAVLMARGAQ
jgi:exopolysaccharide production protein ExoY